MRPLFYNLIYPLLVLAAIAFIIFNSVTLQEFVGENGTGTVLGFTFNRSSIIGVLLLIISLPAYYFLKSHFKR